MRIKVLTETALGIRLKQPISGQTSFNRQDDICKGFLSCCYLRGAWKGKSLSFHILIFESFFIQHLCIKIFYQVFSMPVKQCTQFLPQLEIQVVLGGVIA